ncbi:hypothetical protein WALSEDRAFT_56545 [Wallemia mellicola CBS 633.66]|uniref:SAGA-associated factor 11 n=1 Tax=Wallemia mellicola (strain ATCC MYA-4683 / CBS 633.66) TaxID=671144 RepID=I4YFV7_WALMC|nr:hypothetical protein WALSEDRAFT_56545 [Wallemia mellicola CBS 633.66]EIM22849.1 hypothetical protein WALSEDRAFT_56545 [Wallemia mellicola CBS 633.66]|eukprot:XP_006956900.1 hypothetical protein WALSEDRAFT_56545 [Wallemia mellicola CBS 633.66]
MSEDTVNELTKLLIGDILFEIILDTKSTQNKQSNQLLYNNPSNSSNNLDYCGIQKGTGDLQNPNFECLICKRQISSNRYAPHLNNCLGLGGSRLSSRNSSNATRNAQPAKVSKPTPTPASTTTTSISQPVKSKLNTKPRQSSPLSTNHSILPRAASPNDYIFSDIQSASNQLFSPTNSSNSSALSSPPKRSLQEKQKDQITNDSNDFTQSPLSDSS